MLNAAKAWLKRVIPAPLLQAMRRRWESFRDWIDTIAFGCRFIVTRQPQPRLLLYFGFAPGDDLLCSAVLRELHKRGIDRILLVSDHRELFVGNGDVAEVRPLWGRYSRDASTVAICRRLARLWGGQFIRLEYAPSAGEDRSRPPARHIIAEMCARAGITGPVTIRPVLNLTDAEKASAAWAAGRIVIQSSGMDAVHPIRNKQWHAERFQAVVDALRGEVEFVQFGGRADPELRYATDLRGRTSARQAAAILHNARLYVGTVGFLMHLARAVDCPGVIVYGGREAPWQSGYTCNLNLYTGISCAPCWRWNTCDYERRCMQQIAVADVVAAIREMLQRARNPLAVDEAEIPPVRLL